MKQLVREVEANRDRFGEHWRKELENVRAELDAFKETFSESYIRLVSLQAWRTELLEQRLSKDSFAFFAEAQNDGLTSHVLAQLGSWRASLKALRSCLENVGYALYYMDHPVELKLWQTGDHFMNFSGVLEYLLRHPATTRLPTHLTGLDAMKREYSMLSRAVHASGASFRMTADGKAIRLWFAERANVGAWATRETHVLTALNLILLTIFRADLAGAKGSNLRKAISLAIPTAKHPELRQRLGVTLFTP